MRVRKWWKNLRFWVNYAFKCCILCGKELQNSVRHLFSPKHPHLQHTRPEKMLLCTTEMSLIIVYIWQSTNSHLPFQSLDSLSQSIRLWRRWPALASWAVRLADSRRSGGGFDLHWFEPVSDTALQGEHDWHQAGLLAAEGRPLCPLHGTFTTAEKEGGLRERLNLCKEADKMRVG